MLRSQLMRLKKEIEAEGFGRYRVFRDFALCPEQTDGGEFFVLENFYVNPDRYSEQVIYLRTADGREVVTYLSDRRLFLHPILIGRPCEVIFSKDGFRVVNLEVLVDRGFYKVFETVYKTQNLDFTLLISNDSDEVYWKNFAVWDKERKALERICKMLMDEREDFLYFDLEEIDIDLEFVGGECVIPPQEEKDLFEDIPEWFCVYEDEEVTGQLSQFGYEEDMYLDCVRELFTDRKEIRLLVGEDLMLTYFVKEEIPLWISQQYLAPLRMLAQRVPCGDGEEELRIARIEMFKSKQLKNIVKDYWPYSSLSVEQLVEYMQVEI